MRCIQQDTAWREVEGMGSLEGLLATVTDGYCVWSSPAASMGIERSI